MNGVILLVEDMEVFREPLAAALRRKAYDVICAHDGRQALAVLNSRQVDLILLDLAMPVMDGLQFLRMLREHPRHKPLPVILLTAMTERDDVVQAGKLGVRDYLLKSRFSLDDLYARVAKYLPTSAPVAASPTRCA